MGWVSRADDAQRLIGRLIDEVHRGQIGRASELCDPVDIDALPVLMDAARAADDADARVADPEAEVAALRDTVQMLRGAIPDPDDLGFIADTLAPRNGAEPSNQGRAHPLARSNPMTPTHPHPHPAPPPAADTIGPGDPIVFNNYGELVCGRLVRLTPKTATIRVPAYGVGWYERKTKRSWVSPAPPEWIARLEAAEQAAAAEVQS